MHYRNRSKKLYSGRSYLIRRFSHYLDRFSQIAGFLKCVSGKSDHSIFIIFTDVFNHDMLRYIPKNDFPWVPTKYTNRSKKSLSRHLDLIRTFSYYLDGFAEMSRFLKCDSYLFWPIIFGNFHACIQYLWVLKHIQKLFSKISFAL